MIRPGQVYCGFISQQLDFEKPGHHDVERGQDWIADCAVRSRHLRALPAQDKQAGKRQNIEKQLSENQEIEQLTVCSGKTERRRPDALCNQGDAGTWLRLTVPTDLKKQAVLRHGVIYPRAGKNQSIVAAEGGNQDCNRHHNRAGRSENDFCDCRGDPTPRRQIRFPRTIAVAPCASPESGKTRR